MRTIQGSGIKGQRSGAARSLWCVVILGLLGGTAVAMADTNTPAFALAGDQVTVGRLTYQVGPNGLPAQITIGVAPEELPLESRKADAKLTDSDLTAVGRGAQLAVPMRVEAMAQGKTAVLAPTEPAKPAMAGEKVACKARLAGGGVNVTVESDYARDGAVNVKVTYGGAKVDTLSLVMELNGACDTVVSGGAPFKADDYRLDDREGLLWGNAAAAGPVSTGAVVAAANRGTPGVPAHLFWGNGDRGFTWLSGGDSGWTIVPAAPSMTLTRDKGGILVWRAMLVNQAADLDKEKTVSFTLLTHPALFREAGRRNAQWMEWPFVGKAAQAVPLTADGRGKATGLVRADAGSVCEFSAAALSLEGVAGGDAVSVAKTLSGSYPMPLFRYLAGTHLSRNSRLIANTPKLVRSGMSTACDQMAIGRALLNDIGFDPAGAAHLNLALKVVTALSRFGYFEADGKTEYLPYWRSRQVLRYGEEFAGNNLFEETVEDPMSQVYVSAWRRPAPAGKTGTKALILIVNEGNQPVREQFYVLSAPRLFGGPNTCRRRDIVLANTNTWDFSSVPANSDWSQAHVAGEGVEMPSAVGDGKKLGEVPCLWDVMDDGFVGRAADKGGQEVYMRVFVPAHSFRLFSAGAVP